jgi:hypothetical protein
VEIRIVAGALVRLVLLHQWNEFLGRPAFGLEIIVVGRGSASVHLADVKSVLSTLETSGRTMKLMDDPPPRMLAQGTTARRPSRYSEGFE